MPVRLPLKDFTYAKFCKLLESSEVAAFRQLIDDFVASWYKAYTEEKLLLQSEGLSLPSAGATAEAPLAHTTQTVPLETLAARQHRRGNEYLKIMESFSMVILKDPFWTLTTADGKNELDHDSDEMALYFELIFSYLEANIVPRIHRFLFVPDKKVDWEIAVKCQEYEYLRPSHLDIKLLPVDLSLLVEKATNTFTDMGFETLPSLKLGHLSTIWKLIQVFLVSSTAPTPSNVALKLTASTESSFGAVSMDDIFPILVYVILKTRPPQLFSDLAYLAATSREMAVFGSFASFYVTNTQVAIEFIRNLSPEKLSEPKEEGLKARTDSSTLDRAPSSLTSSPQPSSTLLASASTPPRRSSSSLPPSTATTPAPEQETKSTASPSTMDGFIHVKNRISKAVGKVADSVGHTVGSVAESVVHRVSPLVTRTPTTPVETPSTPEPTPDISPNDFVHLTDNVASPEAQSSESSETSASVPIDAPTMQSLYPFYSKQPEELSSDDIKQLLDAYRSLADFHFSKSSARG